MAKQIFRKIASDFEPPPPKQISARKRAKNSGFCGGKSVGRALRVPRSGVFCVFFYKTGVSLRLRSNLLYQKFVNDESPATASLRSATPKKNVPCFSDLRATDFFSKKERTFFFGVLPSKYSGSVAGFNADSVLPNYFSGEKDLAKPRLISRAEEGSGEESARASIQQFRNGLLSFFKIY